MGFREELRSFLHNGVQFRGDLLSDIIVTLEELVRVVERQDSYRFFSSSLLIIYDGAECPEEGRVSSQTNGTATHPIDSQHTHSRGARPPTPTSLSKQNGLSFPNSDRTKPSLSDCVNGASNGYHMISHTHKSYNGDSSHDNHMTDSIHMTNGDLNSWLTETRKKVDIRMIDFVHGVHGSFGDPTLSGSDQDYLVGLKALLTKFRELSDTT